MALMVLDGQSYFTEFSPTSGFAQSFAIDQQLHDEVTPFQHIEIYATTHFGNLMAMDGFIQLTERDNFLYHEMLAHPALFTHADPQDVVIIGGGDCGTLLEVLKHQSIQSARLIEIDRRVTELATQYFPQLCASNDDPRAHIDFCDGIAWMAEAEPESLDVILIDSTDPIGPAKGLFTRDFYYKCWLALRDGGILVQQSESPILDCHRILTPLQNAMIAANFTDLRTIHFPQPCYPSGWWTHTLAGKHCDLACFREEAILAGNVSTRYYNADIHRAAHAVPEWLKKEYPYES